MKLQIVTLSYFFATLATAIPSPRRYGILISVHEDNDQPLNLKGERETLRVVKLHTALYLYLIPSQLIHFESAKC